MSHQPPPPLRRHRCFEPAKGRGWGGALHPQCQRQPQPAGIREPVGRRQRWMGCSHALVPLARVTKSPAAGGRRQQCRGRKPLSLPSPAPHGPKGRPRQRATHVEARVVGEDSVVTQGHVLLLPLLVQRLSAALQKHPLGEEQPQGESQPWSPPPPCPIWPWGSPASFSDPACVLSSSSTDPTKHVQGKRQGGWAAPRFTSPSYTPP